MSEDIVDDTAIKSNKPEYSVAQMYKMSAVYRFIAQLIPTEGRDYSVNFEFLEGDNFRLQLIPHTSFGKIWCDHCTDELRKANSK